MHETLKHLIKWIFYMPPVFFSYECLSWNMHRRNIAHQYGSLRLHVGAGNRILDGWLNIDIYPGRDLLTMKLPKGLRKFSDQSVRYIYASHFLEHLAYPQKATEFIQPLLQHLTEDACLGQVSEIFDGDPPHEPKGCFAQAWSVAELIRAFLLINS